jgi:hypothetical protein
MRFYSGVEAGLTLFLLQCGLVVLALLAVATLVNRQIHHRLRRMHLLFCLSALLASAIPFYIVGLIDSFSPYFLYIALLCVILEFSAAIAIVWVWRMQ